MARKAAKEKEGIGARVEKLRNQNGWTQEELADKLFVKREALKNKELGLRPFTLEETCRLSKLFNVTVDYLANGTSTENVSIHERLGLTNEGIEALETYKMLDDGNRMKVISHILSYMEVLDALYEYMTFQPKRKGYYRKTIANEKVPFITTLISPELYEDQLEAILMRVIRLAKQGKRPSWFYTSFEDCVTSEGDEELMLAEEPSEFNPAKKSGKKEPERK